MFCMTVAINVINRLIVMMEAKCVFLEVETETLHVIQMNFVLQY